MKKLEDLLNKRDSEIESEKKAREAARKAAEAAREARKKEFIGKLGSYPLTGGGIGFAISLVVGFFKGCGLFHFDERKGDAYLFDTKDAGSGFWTLPLIGAILGLLYAIISSKFKND